MKRIDLRAIKFRSDEYREGFLAGFKFFSQKECFRHCEDIRQINHDICNLINIDLPEGLDLDAWYEIAPPDHTIVSPEDTIYPPIVKGK